MLLQAYFLHAGGGNSESPSPSYSGTLTKSGYWYGEQSYIQLNQDAPSAVAECNECSTQNFSYTWQIDMDDDGVFDGEADVEYQQTSYAPNRLEYAKSVRLIATHDEIKEPLINIYHPTEMVKEIISNDRGGEVFAALKTDGNAVIWGNERMGADTNLNGTDKLSNVRSIHISSSAVAAIKQDNSVEVWGQSTHGGDASLVQDKLKNITNIYSNAYSMVALNSEGGKDREYGGDTTTNNQKVLSNITNIVSTTFNYGAFAALTKEGEVITWGKSDAGGDSEAVKELLVAKAEAEVKQ